MRSGSGLTDGSIASEGDPALVVAGVPQSQGVVKLLRVSAFRFKRKAMSWIEDVKARSERDAKQYAMAHPCRPSWVRYRDLTVREVDVERDEPWATMLRDGWIRIVER